MRNFIAHIRSAAFFVAFYGGTVVMLAVAFLIMWLRLRRPFIGIAIAWSRYHRFCARWFAGQRVVVEGKLPKHPVLFVLKHESMFETLDLPSLLSAPTIAAKRELLEIPAWGRLARAYGLLPVDREAGASALRELRRNALASLAAGRSLALFPEGTRVEHGDAPPLKSGFAGLYSALDVPVIPIAVVSGDLNPRGGFLRYPGVVRYRVGETVPPGLRRKEAEARVHAAINALNGPR